MVGLNRMLTDLPNTANVLIDKEVKFGSEKLQIFNSSNHSSIFNTSENIIDQDNDKSLSLTTILIISFSSLGALILMFCITLYIRKVAQAYYLRKKQYINKDFNPLPTENTISIDKNNIKKELKPKAQKPTTQKATAQQSATQVSTAQKQATQKAAIRKSTAQKPKMHKSKIEQHKIHKHKQYLSKSLETEESLKLNISDTNKHNKTLGIDQI